ncbi:anoctamin-4-like isoform X4 [Clytia hemisphaerica]|uniref:Anoctamin n=1 Tax=Clytia hemisphaerica TaxID=252671 RepID=A0A7M5X4K5_9CNID
MYPADSEAHLLTNTQGDMSDEKTKTPAAEDLMFEDGVRRIDIIFAYEANAELDPQRQKYLDNLKVLGLEFEQAKMHGKDYGSFEGQEQKENETHFIKVHAPFDLLCDTAEDMKIKMPVKENDINIPAWYENYSVINTIKNLDPFIIREPKTVDEKLFFVATFDKDRLKEFVGHENQDTFFSPAERSRIVYFLMEKTKFGDQDLDVGILKMQHEGIITDVYPLHDGPTKEIDGSEPTNDRQRLQEDWARPGRIFKYQPVPAIKEYFGEKIALYFSWLGFYTAFLIPAAIVGVICFIYGVGTAVNYTPIKELCAEDTNNNGTGAYKFVMCPLCDKLCSYYLLSKEGCLYSKVTHFFDNEATLFFAIFMSLWATIFLEFWKRKQVSLAYEWHTMDFEEDEERPRPEYLAAVTRLKENPVTGKMEPYMPLGQKCKRLTGAFGIVIFFVVLVLAAVVSVVIFRAAFYAFLLKSDNAMIRQRAKLVVSGVAACVNLIAINLLKFIYQRIAVMITNWENPRTRTDYEDSFTVKMFWFQFANTYASIFYVAFFKSEFFTGSVGRYKRFTASNFRFDGCSVQGCFMELTLQLIIIMVGQQIIGNIMEIVIPFLKTKYRDYKGKKQHLYESSEEPRWVTDYEGEMQTKFSLFWQYLEIVLQYGFVTMFVAAFPLAPLFALINNMVEIRLDASNFIHNFRRPVAERAEDIGAWYSILATLTTFSTIVNGFVLAFTSELIPKLVYRYYASTTGSLEGFTEWSLSKFPIAEIGANGRPDNPQLNIPDFNATANKYCLYPGYHESKAPYKRDLDYWVITSARLAFILAFQALVITITWVIGYLVPDVPKTLELRIKRENFIAAEMEKNHKERTGKRKPRPDDDRNDVTLSGEITNRGHADSSLSPDHTHTTYI